MVSVNKYLELVQHLQASGDLGPGRTFWVNGGTAQHKANGGSDNNQNDGLSPERPFATIDYATGRCTAGRGDNIMVLPTHTESISEAGDITSDVDGVTYWGLGRGDDAPTITFDTDTAATWVVSGSNVRIHGFKFATGVDELVVAFPVTGPYFHMSNCYADVANATYQCVKFITLSAAAQEAKFTDCEFRGTAANGTANLEVLSCAATLGLTLKRCTMDIIGAAGVGPVHFTGITKYVYMEDCLFRNRVASATACIDCDSLAVEGVHKNCVFVLGTIATAGSGITPVVCASGMFVSHKSGCINDQDESDAIVGSAST